MKFTKEKNMFDIEPPTSRAWQTDGQGKIVWTFPTSSKVNNFVSNEMKISCTKMGDTDKEWYKPDIECIEHTLAVFDNLGQCLKIRIYAITPAQSVIQFNAAVYLSERRQWSCW